MYKLAGKNGEIMDDEKLRELDEWCEGKDYKGGSGRLEEDDDGNVRMIQCGVGSRGNVNGLTIHKNKTGLSHGSTSPFIKTNQRETSIELVALEGNYVQRTMQVVNDADDIDIEIGEETVEIEANGTTYEFGEN